MRAEQGCELAWGRGGGVPARGAPATACPRKAKRGRGSAAGGGGSPGGGACRRRSWRRGCRGEQEKVEGGRRLKEKLTCGPHMSVSVEREAAGVFWAIRKYGGLQVGPKA